MTVSFEHATLSNGLKIIAEVSPRAHTAALGFFVRTGARDESPKLMGVSHFLEHMMFKGSATRTAEQVNNDFDMLGASHNAFTSNEMTAFWAHVLPENLSDAENILADILRPSLREEDFEEERGVILEEIAMYEDHPVWVLYEQAMENYYRNHPLAHRVLGTTETIKNLQRDSMASYFSDRYSADNTVIAMAGQVDFDAMVTRVESDCGEWEATRPSRENLEPNVSEGEFTLELPTVKRQYSLMLCPAPAIQDDRRYAAAALAQLLGDSDGSRLYWSLVETGLAEAAQAQYNGRDSAGDYLIYTVCRPDQTQQVEQIVRQEAEQLPQTLQQDELDRARSKIATSATLAGERPAGRMRRLGQLWTYTGEYRSLEEELERIDALTIDDLVQCAKAFPLKPKVVGHLRPQR